MRLPKEQVYLEMAVILAQRSTCLDKNVGCIITNARNEVIGSGYNGAPRGVLHCCDVGNCVKEVFNNKDMCPSAHAEQNALLQCKVPEQIHTIYVTLSPCIVCIRIIMNTPCKRIVFLHEHKHPEPKELWGGDWVKYVYK